MRFTELVYVLHCFQKKSKRGAETPRRDMATIIRIVVGDKPRRGRGRVTVEAA